MLATLSAIIFTILTGILVLFQGCLAAGVPWGAASMGGRYPGKYPTKMRVVATVNILILVFIEILVLSRSHLAFFQLNSIARTGIWFIVFFFTLSTLMNTITPSKIERIWAPVAFVQLVASLIIAFS